MDNAAEHKRLGQILVDASVISPKQLETALAAQAEAGKRLVDTLIHLGYLTPADFIDFMSQQQGLASVDLSNYVVPADLVNLIPREFVVEHEVFPIDRIGKLLTLGMVCPVDTKTIHALEAQTDLTIKAVLCSAKDIRSAIARYYPATDQGRVVHFPASADQLSGMEGALRLQGVGTLIRRMKTMPTLPQTVMRVREALDDIDIAISDVGQVIAEDPPIATKVLGVANSAAFGFASQVDSIERAVALLGLKEAYSLVLSAAVINLFDERQRFDYKSFWIDAMGCATTARAVAKAVGSPYVRGSFAAGLLHDIGRIVLLETVPDLYQHIEQNQPEQALLQDEINTLGVTHGEAGYELATQWNLPAELRMPMRFHNAPLDAPEHAEAAAIVSIAAALSRSKPTEQVEGDGVYAELAPCFDLLRFDQASAKALIKEIAPQNVTRIQWQKRWESGARS